MCVRSLVVVGASLAGLKAVETAREAGFRGAITLVGAEQHLPYDRPPLSKAALMPGGEMLDVAYRTESELQEIGVELRLGSPATSLDVAGRSVTVGDRSIGFDRLVIATGSTARTLAGTEHLRGVHSLRTLDDAAAVRNAFATARRVVVIGAGFIGAEVASAARKHGLDVTILEAAPVPLERAVGAEMGMLLSDLHVRNGTRLVLGAQVLRLEGDTAVERVVLADGSVLEADLVIAGIGADPGVGWLKDSGVHLDGGVVADAFLETNVPGVFAAGDVVRWHNTVFGRPMRLEHWTSASEQGAVAGWNAVGPGPMRSYGTVPYFWSDWYGERIQFAGVVDADEMRIVSGDPAGRRFVALYRSADRVVGALAVNYPSHIMKYRAMIGRGAEWADALEFAETRNRVAA